MPHWLKHPVSFCLNANVLAGVGLAASGDISPPHFPPSAHMLEDDVFFLFHSKGASPFLEECVRY